jgi:hypothetical protein
VTPSSLPILTRLWLAWVCWFRVLFDGSFAARVAQLSEPAPDQLPAPEPAPPPRRAAEAAVVDSQAALQLLGLLQREGRLIDFLQQDVTSFSDADVGAAARVVHEGCRRALSTHASVSSVRNEAEGAKVTVLPDEVAQVKLVGNVSGSAPYRGVLRHRGWRIEALKLPALIGQQDLRVVAPAEVELG